MSGPDLEDFMPKKKADLLGPENDTEGRGPVIELPDDFTEARKPGKPMERAENMG